MTGLSFPSNFLWGTATAAHQIEGNNTNSDWWHFEHQPGTVLEVSGDACDSWHRWPGDLDLVASLGLNCYRFSIEWARLEPAEGEFSAATFEHYRRVIAGCHERGLIPIVTLHHFTLPQWVAQAGGFEAPRIVEWLGRYAARVAAELGADIGMACTINEPNIVALMGYRFAVFPPKVADAQRFAAVSATMRAAHAAMRDALKAGPGTYPVGLTLSMTDYQAQPGGEALMAKVRREMEDDYLDAVAQDDFLGVQCYSSTVFNEEGMVHPGPDEEITPMGYRFWPQCVEATLVYAASRVSIPLVITENGISATDDATRRRYLEAAIAGAHRALGRGIDLRGYIQWSLLDNFEWALGYAQQFGIVAVDRTTQVRTPKPSAYWFGSVARANALPEAD
jgi:beta-glucosidase